MKKDALEIFKQLELLDRRDFAARDCVDGCESPAFAKVCFSGPQILSRAWFCHSHIAALATEGYSLGPEQIYGYKLRHYECGCQKLGLDYPDELGDVTRDPPVWTVKYCDYHRDLWGVGDAMDIAEGALKKVLTMGHGDCCEGGIDQKEENVHAECSCHIVIVQEALEKLSADGV
jgi:hypothetical protein